MSNEPLAGGGGLGWAHAEPAPPLTTKCVFRRWQGREHLAIQWPLCGSDESAPGQDRLHLALPHRTIVGLLQRTRRLLGPWLRVAIVAWREPQFCFAVRRPREVGQVGGGGLCLSHSPREMSRLGIREGERAQSIRSLCRHGRQTSSHPHCESAA